MDKYEYLVTRINNDSTLIRLDDGTVMSLTEMGNDGWELCSVVPSSSGREWQNKAVFIRPLVDEPEQEQEQKEEPEPEQQPIKSWLNPQHPGTW